MELILYAASIEECEKQIKNPNAKNYIIVYDDGIEEMMEQKFENRARFRNLKSCCKERNIFLVSYSEFCEYIISSRAIRFGL